MRKKNVILNQYLAKRKTRAMCHCVIIFRDTIATSSNRKCDFIFEQF